MRWRVIPNGGKFDHDSSGRSTPTVRVRRHRGASAARLPCPGPRGARLQIVVRAAGGRSCRCSANGRRTCNSSPIGIPLGRGKCRAVSCSGNPPQPQSIRARTDTVALPGSPCPPRNRQAHKGSWGKNRRSVGPPRSRHPRGTPGIRSERSECASRKSLPARSCIRSRSHTPRSGSCTSARAFRSAPSGNTAACSAP